MRRLTRILFTATTFAALTASAPSWAQDEEGTGFLESTQAFRYAPLLAVAGVGLLLEQVLESSHSHAHTVAH